MNEELQSTTEELETSKEELQSMNEELQTVNQELKNKVEELTRSNTDLQNLMASTEIATLFLDRRLRVVRFTPAAASLFNLIPSDVGRPLEHVTHRLDVEDFVGLAEGVLSSLVPIEESVTGRDGGGYTLRVLPYRTADDRIEGVVVDGQRRRPRSATPRTRRSARPASRRPWRRWAATRSGSPRCPTCSGRPRRSSRRPCRRPSPRSSTTTPKSGALRMEGGTGWPEGSVGAATVPDAPDSLGGFALAASQAVAVPDAGAEDRFAMPRPPRHGRRPERHDRAGRRAGDGAVGGPRGLRPRAPGLLRLRPALYGVGRGGPERGPAAGPGPSSPSRTSSPRSRRSTRRPRWAWRSWTTGSGTAGSTAGWPRSTGPPSRPTSGSPTHDILPDLAREIEPILQRVVQAGEAVEDIEIRGTVAHRPVPRSACGCAATSRA